MQTWTRAGFFGLGTVAAVSLGWSRRLDAASPVPTGTPLEPVPAAFPAQDPEVVREVVGVAHGRFERLRELVDARPALARAAWDWGYGDWETALGAAAHVGHREIAEYLISRGAPPTLFSAAMLGQLEVVRSLVAVDPAVVRIPGPHGITLLAHARAGGERAAGVVAYLEGLGGADGEISEVELPTPERDALLGSYRFGPGERDILEVELVRGRLMLRRAEGAPRGLLHRGSLTFSPAGADAVRVHFVQSEAGWQLLVFDPDLLVRATRVAVP